MRFLKHAFALLTALSLLLLAGCGGAAEESASRSVFAMDTVMDLTAYGKDAEAAVVAGVARITALEQAFSVTIDESDISRINHAYGKPVDVSDDTAALLTDALRYCMLTHGALDVSVYPVLKAWGFTTQDYRVPQADELQDLLARVDYSRVHVDGSAVTVPAGMEIDLGSVAKGYTGDQIMQIYRDHGITSGMISLGGNVQTLGSKPDGSAWRIAVQNPLGEGYVGVIEARGEAVVTSGGYERYFERNGETYWHIIDPATGAPAKNGVISATIVSESGTRCDALSTALFILGQDGAETYWRTHGDFEYLLVLDNGDLVVSQGLADRFEAADDWSGHALTVVTK